MPVIPAISRSDQALTGTTAGDILQSTGPTGVPVTATPGTDYSAPDVAETWTGVKTLGERVVVPYTKAFTFPNDPTVTDGTPFVILHDHSPFALADDPILVIGYNQGPGLIPDKPSFTLTFEGGYKPSETYHTMEFNLDFYPNIEGKFAQRVLAISYNREQSLGAYGFLGSRGHFYNEDASVLLMQLLSRDETNGTTYPPQILTYVPLYAGDDIFATRLLIDNPDHVPLTVVGAKTPGNELYSGFNIEWNEANNRFENQTTIGSGGIFFAQDGTIKLFSALSQAAGSEVTSKLSYNPSGVLSVGGPYDGTSGVAIEGHGVVKSRVTTGSATVQAQSPNVLLMMLANEGAGWGIFGTQTNHPLMFYSNNTKRGFADTDGTLYWGTGNVFWVSPTGAVTAPSLTVPTVAGGSTAAQDLQLQSTTHPTKGKIRLGANAFYDEATGDTHFPGAGANSFRVGVGSTAGNSGVAVGPGATVANGFGVATGYQANASNFGVAIGYLASATGTNAFALGRQASATHAYACAVGFLTASTRDYEFRWGSGNPLSTAPVFALAGNSSTTRNLGVFDVQTEWVDATHATRKSRAKIGTYDFGGFREGVRMESDGAQALLSFFGGSAVARQAAIPNTSGADLATLEAEVNKLKAVIRAYNLMAP